MLLKDICNTVSTVSWERMNYRCSYAPREYKEFTKPDVNMLIKYSANMKSSQGRNAQETRSIRDIVRIK